MFAVFRPLEGKIAMTKSQWSLIKKLTRNPIEYLEKRRLLAAAPVVTDHVLVLAGTASDEVMSIEKLNTGYFRVTVDGVVNDVDGSDVQSVSLTGGDGADTLSVVDIPIPVTVEGSAGDDTITSSGSNQVTITGGVWLGFDHGLAHLEQLSSRRRWQ